MDRQSKHLSSEERGVILAEHDRRSSHLAIGRLLGRPASMVCRILARGRRVGSSYWPRSARRVYDDDMARASLFIMDLDKAYYDTNTNPMLTYINVGTGADITIPDLAKMVARVIGYAGQIITDPSKPDGTMRKLMDVSHFADNRVASRHRPGRGYCRDLSLVSGTSA
jgi:nucleoside-diphosphate-sugar epimerase